MKMKAILKWIIGLMVINGPFTMESSNINTGNSYHQSFKIPSIGSLMKTTTLFFTMGNFTLSKNQPLLNFNNSHTINNNNLSQNITTKYPSFFDSLTSLGSNIDTTINGINYKGYWNNSESYYQWNLLLNKNNHNKSLTYFDSKYLNMNKKTLANKNLVNQGDNLYNTIIIFDSVKTHYNFLDEDETNNDLIYYEVKIFYKNIINSLMESSQIHLATNYFGRDLTTNEKPLLNDDQLNLQKQQIIEKYKFYNKEIVTYKFHYRDGNIVICKFSKENNNYHCIDSQNKLSILMDNSENLSQYLTRKFPHFHQYQYKKKNYNLENRHKINYKYNTIYMILETIDIIETFIKKLKTNIMKFNNDIHNILIHLLIILLNH